MMKRLSSRHEAVKRVGEKQIRRATRKSTRSARLQFQMLERRVLLAASLAPPSSDLIEDANHDSTLTWFESLDDVERLPLHSLSRIDQHLAPGVAGPVERSSGEWIIQLSEEASNSLTNLRDARAMLPNGKIETQVISGLGRDGLILVKAFGPSKLEIETSFGESPHIENFQVNQMVEGQTLVPDDPEFVGGLLHGLEAIGMTAGWEETIGSLNTVVGVIDSGIDPEHPDLYLNIWLNQGELPPEYLDDQGARLTDIDGDGLITFYDLNNVTRAQQSPFGLTFGGWSEGLNAEFVNDFNNNGRIDAHDLLADANWADGRDTDRNGFYDDLFGVNFRAGSGDPSPENDPTDTLGHGTHVAGTIGAIGGNGLGIVGVNWQTSLMALRILDNNNQGDTGAAIRAINYAHQMRTRYVNEDSLSLRRGANVRVLNNSWGQPGGFDVSLQSTIQDSGDDGILFVAAAGNGNILGQGVDNDSTAFYPASYDSNNIISVAAANDNDRLATFSNFGSTTVDLVAPGVGIRSTVPGGGFQSANGTSMATPHVAGTAALIWSALPQASVDEVRDAILSSTRPTSQPQVVASGGHLNVANVIPSSTFAPTAVLSAAEYITTSGMKDTEFTVEFSHRSGINPATIGDENIVVVRDWGNTQPAQPTLKEGSLVASADGKTLSASYILKAPGDATFQAHLNPAHLNPKRKNVSVTNSETLAIPDRSTVTSQTLVEGLGEIDRDFTVRIDLLHSDLSELDITLIAPNGLRSKLVTANVGFDLGANFIETTFDDSAEHLISNVLMPHRGSYRPVESLQSLGVTDPNGLWTLEITDSHDPFGFDQGQLKEWTLTFPTKQTEILRSELVATNVSQLTGDFDVEFNVRSGQFGNATATLVSPTGRRSVLFRNHNASYSDPSSFRFSDTVLENPSDSSGALMGDYLPAESLSALGQDGPNGTWTLELEGVFNVESLPDLSWTMEHRGSWDPMDFGDYFVSVTAGSVEAVDGSTLPEDRSFGKLQVKVIDPTVLYVDRETDDLAPGSLRSAITLANDPDSQVRTILVDEGHYTLSRPSEPDPSITFPIPPWGGDAETGALEWSNASTGDLDVLGRLTIVGDTHGETVIDAKGQERVFKVHPNASLTLSRLTVQGGIAPATHGGAGILSAGNLRVDQSQIVGNVTLDGPVSTQSFGGGIAVWDGTVSINESRVTNNESSLAGGLYLGGSSELTIRRSTFDNNVGGGLVTLSSGVVTVENSTFSANSGAGGAIQSGLVGEYESLDGNALSADGRFAAVASQSSDLVWGDQNSVSDIFVLTRSTGSIERISATATGQEPNGPSYSPAFSADGRFVAFASDASNLVIGDENENADIFVYDRIEKTVDRVSLGNGGIEGNGSSYAPSISADGRFVAFYSLASNLVPGDTNGKRDVFLYDRQLETVRALSINVDQELGNDDSYAPSISADGKFVTFHSKASNLVPDDSNGFRDIFVVAVDSMMINRASVSDAQTQSDGNSYAPSISADGRYIAFYSFATNLVANDTNSVSDIFVVDRTAGSIQRISVDGDGVQGNEASRYPAISADGRYVAFESLASNLDNLPIPDQFDLYSNVFLADRQNGTVEQVGGIEGLLDFGISQRPSISDDGRVVSFETQADLFFSEAHDIAVIDLQDDSIRTIRPDYGRLVVRQSTIAHTFDSQSSIYGPAEVDNSLFAGNIVPSELTSDATIGPYNLGLLDTDLHLLGPLTNSELAAATHPLLLGNPAIDSADPLAEGSIDQLGAVRVNPDLGAVEATSAEIAGTVFADLNNNGRRDAGEIGLSGLSVLLSRVTGTDAQVQAASTDSLGGLRFQSLDPGEYRLANEPVQNWSTYRPGPTVARSNAFENDEESASPAISHSGRFIAFESDADNLSVIDQNNRKDVFVYDRLEQRVELLSRASFFQSGDDDSGSPSISGDGRFVAFESDADNLVSGDTNLYSGIFVYDRQTDSIERVSVSSQGVLGDRDSVSPSISVNGRFVAFESNARNLVPGDTNSRSDVFVFDRQTDVIERISIDTNREDANHSSQDPSISGDGRFVAFASLASDLVSPDNNQTSDIFVADRLRDTMTRVSVNEDDQPGNAASRSPAISSDGRYVAFISDASNLVPDDLNGLPDVFVYDLQLATIDRLSVGEGGIEADGASHAPALSADGRYVSFTSDASNLVAGDTNGKRDVFVVDRLSGNLVRIDRNVDRVQSNDDSDSAMLSGDGNFVAFESLASNLVGNDGNAVQDIFVTSSPFGTPSIELSLRAGQNEAAIEIGLVPDPGQISGTVFYDIVENAALDAGEMGVGDVTVFLDTDRNGTLDPGEQFVETDSEGRYEFENVSAFQDHSITIELPSGYELVAPNSTEGFSWELFLPAGGSVAGRDFALRFSQTTGQSNSSAVSGRVYEDRNGNGRFDEAIDVPLGGHEVFLDASNFGIRDTNEPRELTDEDGFYSFEELSPRNVAVATISDSEFEHISPLGSQFELQTFPLFDGFHPFGNPQAISSADFNDDGFLDVAVALGEANRLSIRLNDGQGNFPANNLDFDLGDDGIGPTSFVIGDFNSNQEIDVALTSNLAGSVTVLLDFDHSSLQFRSRNYVKVGEGPLDIAAEDLNSDQAVDLVVVNQVDNDVQVLLNNGDGGFNALPPIHSPGNQPISIVVGKFNSDEDEDLAVVHALPRSTNTPFGDVQIFAGDGTGGFVPTEHYEVGAFPIDSAAADFNSDGRPDLAVSNFNSNSISILLSQGGGGLKVQPSILGTSSGAFDIAIADIENDGDSDVITSNLRDRNISIFRNNGVDPVSGEVRFQPLENIGLAQFSFAQRMPLVVADFDNDGSAFGGMSTNDIITVPSRTDTLHVLKNRLVDGSHRIALDGLNAISGLDFVVRPSILPPHFDPIDTPRPIVENDTAQSVIITGITKGRSEGPDLQIEVFSSAPSVIAHPTVTRASGGSTATVRYQPVENSSGEATLTVRLTDAGVDQVFGTPDDGVLERSFVVSVLPIHDTGKVTFLTPVIVSNTETTTSSILVETAAQGMLNGWIDFNLDGDWDDDSEHVLIDASVNAGTEILSFESPATAIPSTTYARFQFSTSGVQSDFIDYQMTLIDGLVQTDVTIDVSPIGTVAVDRLGDKLRISRGEDTLFSVPDASVNRLNLLGDTGASALQASLEAITGEIHVDPARMAAHVILGENDNLDLTQLQVSDLRGVDALELRNAASNRITLDFSAIENLSPSDSLRLTIDEFDMVDAGENWLFKQMVLEDGAVIHTFEQSGSTLEVDSPHDWTNPLQRYDVNHDGLVTVRDALSILNELANPVVVDGGGNFFPMESQDTSDFAFFDTDRNSRLSPLDALQVINWIAKSMAASGVGSEQLHEFDGDSETSAMVRVDAGRFSDKDQTLTAEQVDSAMLAVESLIPYPAK